jgi:coenzyme Q-binding protein COQ10
MPYKNIIKVYKNQGLEVSQVLDVILNVDKYNQFVPHCSHSKVLQKNNDFIEAEITISFSVFKVSYTSIIKYKSVQNKAEVLVKEKSGNVFKNLQNIWLIEVDENSISINFDVRFEIKNFILNKIASSSLNIISEIILNAFLKRINQVYNVNIT